MQHKSEEEKKKNIHLLDCVKLFTVEEQLGEEDPWCVMFTIMLCTTHTGRHTDTRTRTYKHHTHITYTHRTHTSHTHITHTHTHTHTIHTTHTSTHLCTYCLTHVVSIYIKLGIVPIAKITSKLSRNLTYGNCQRFW